MPITVISWGPELAHPTVDAELLEESPHPARPRQQAIAREGRTMAGRF